MMFVTPSPLTSSTQPPQTCRVRKNHHHRTLHFRNQSCEKLTDSCVSNFIAHVQTNYWTAVSGPTDCISRTFRTCLSVQCVSCTLSLPPLAAKTWEFSNNANHNLLFREKVLIVWCLCAPLPNYANIPLQVRHRNRWDALTHWTKIFPSAASETRHAENRNTWRFGTTVTLMFEKSLVR